MTGERTSRHERLLELLADQATQGLSPDERAEIDRLLKEFEDIDPGSFDRAAAILDQALAPHGDALPASLRDRLEADAVGWAARRKAVPTAKRRWTTSLPWVLAAACLLLAVSGWWPRRAPPREAPSLSELRRRVAEAPGTIVARWQDADHRVTGDVVWNNAMQEGYLTFRGLAPNDPAAVQYQLWIFDAARGKPDAVDGGVFDISGDAGEVIVPIDAELRVHQPKLFAVTTEPPGGVVQHDPELDPARYKIILTAPPDA